MAQDKLLILFNRLTVASDLGKVNWQRGSVPSLFVASFPNYSVAIQEEKYFDEEIGEPSESYKLSIFDQLGDVVEVIHPGTIFALGERHSYKKFETLYEVARRKAVGVDKAIDDIISGLPETAQEIEDNKVPF